MTMAYFNGTSLQMDGRSFIMDELKQFFFSVTKYANQDKGRGFDANKKRVNAALYKPAYSHERNSLL